MQEIERLLDVMKALREPETGCPWDQEQSFETIAPYTIEEAYEVADAIERNDMRDLKDELGDLLFQVVYHAQMANEEGEFDFADVVAGLNEKLIRRHPHVFGDEQVKNKQHLEQRWEQHKQAERDHKNKNKSELSGIASSLPALRWSHKLQKRAASSGFDWPNITPVFDKLDEEVGELKAEIAHTNNQQRILDEFGDVLFVCVNLAMHLELNAEQALRHANRKFISRFTMMEQLLNKDNKQLSDCGLDELEQYWQKSKTQLARRRLDR